MPETFREEINRILRDHQGYTGDGQGGVGDLPIGDRSTARKPIEKRDLREAFLDFADVAEAAQSAAVSAALYDPTLRFNFVSDLMEEGRTFTTGTILEAEGHKYKCVPVVSNEIHFTLAGGQAVKVLHAADGSYSLAAWPLVMDGVTIDSVWLQKAMNAAAAERRLLRGAGDVAIDTKFVIKGRCDFGALRVNVYNTPKQGVEVSTGNGENPTDILDLQGTQLFVLPNIVNMTKPAVGWEGQKSGLRYVNVQNAKIVEQYVSGFDVGVVHAGYSNGCGYNAVQAGYLSNNKVNRLFTVGDASGWTNRWDFFSGKYFHFSAEGTEVPGVHHIKATTGHPNVINDINFFGASLEGQTIENEINIGGTFFMFMACRWENHGAGPSAKFVGTGPSEGSANVIAYGRGSDGIRIIQEGTAGKNKLISARNTSIRTASGPTEITKNESGSAGPSYVVLEAAANEHAGDWATAYAAFIGAQKIAGKRGADAEDRARLDTLNGKVLVGSGTTAPTAGIEAAGAAGVKAVGTWYFPEKAAVGALIGHAALYFDGANFSVKLPDGTLKQLAYV